MTIEEFTEAVWRLERIRIKILDRDDATVEDYNQQEADRDDRTVSIFLLDRIEPCVGGRGVVVVDKSGKPVHGAVRLKTLRASY